MSLLDAFGDSEVRPEIYRTTLTKLTESVAGGGDDNNIDRCDALS